MKKPMLFLLFLVVSSLSTFSQNEHRDITKAQAIIKGTTPQLIVEGEAIFKEKKSQKGVTLNVHISGLKPLTYHAIHLHQNGSCDSAGNAAGGHWNPQQMKHGLLLLHTQDSLIPAHKGDIGNLFSNEEGIAKLHLSTREWCISCDDPSKKIIGRSVIIHEGKDDFTTQPTGASGGRIGCGVVDWYQPMSER